MKRNAILMAMLLCVSVSMTAWGDEYADDIQAVESCEVCDEEQEILVNPYADIINSLSEADYLLFAQALYCEANGSNAACTRATAEVMLNRVLSDAFPDTLREVLYQPGHFTPAKYFTSVTPMQAQIDAIEWLREYGRTYLPADYVYFATKRQTLAKDHIWLGEKGNGHWFGRAKGE